MITRKYNYRCRGCNIWQEQDQNELSAEEIKRGLDILKNLGIVEIVFSGGDPLLRDDAQEILENEGISVAVTPTISQMNLHEILDITNYFSQREIPLWYCLYSYDLSSDVNQLFRIGKANDEFVIRDKQAMVSVCGARVGVKKKNRNILMTTKLLRTLRSLYSEEKRTWNCQALQNFFVIDHSGRITGCQLH